MDDFYLGFTKMIENCPKLEDSTIKRRQRKGKLSDLKMMRIYLLIHFGQFTNVKQFYLNYVCEHLNELFPDLISYERFNSRQDPFMMNLKIVTKLNIQGIVLSRSFNAN